MNKSVLGNCLFLSVYHWAINKNSKIKIYYNKKYKVFSFYVVVNNEYKITFRRDRTKPIVIKNFLFYLHYYNSKI